MSAKEEQDEEERPQHQRRSSRGWIIVSGTRIVPSVSVVFTVPWSSEPPVVNLPRKRARLA